MRRLLGAVLDGGDRRFVDTAHFGVGRSVHPPPSAVDENGRRNRRHGMPFLGQTLAEPPLEAAKVWPPQQVPLAEEAVGRLHGPSSGRSARRRKRTSPSARRASRVRVRLTIWRT